MTATADARSGETFAAKITAIEPAISATTGLIDVQATFEPEDGRKLLSGMFTRLRVALPTKYDQVVVPQVAINYNMYGEIAYILSELSAEERETLVARQDFDREKLTMPIGLNKSLYLPKIAKDLCPVKRGRN